MSIVCSREKDGTVNVLVCGKVTRDAERKSTAHGDKVKFTVAYGKKKYQDCEAWMDSKVGEIAACLEAGDVIGAAGTHRSWEYNGKTYSSVDVDMIFSLVQGAPPASDASTPPASSSASFAELDDDLDSELPF